MVETPCEGVAAEGGERHGRRERVLNTDVNLPGTPEAARQAVGVSHAESSRRNIYAFKLTPYIINRESGLKK
ncbi:MAG: hypothetical protein PHR65_03620 [Syntrophomonadaceae bacterium]|nr:hypothetical protein [Syntrophomonadaceae bacterium]